MFQLRTASILWMLLNPVWNVLALCGIDYLVDISEEFLLQSYGLQRIKKDFKFPRQRIHRTTEGRKGAGVRLGTIKNILPTSTKPVHISNRTNMVMHSRSYRNLSIISAHSSEVWKRRAPWLRCYSPGLQLYWYLSEAFRTQGTREKYQHKFGHKTWTTRSSGKT